MTDRTAPAFTRLPDLASRALAGSVVYANDELFAERENLIRPGRAVFSTEDFGHKGKTYDGWETRRRRETGNDYALIRLGVPGRVHGVVIDTAWFIGNYPPFASVEATSVEGQPSPAELQQADWVTLVAKSEIEGNTDNFFEVTDERRFTHVRLSIYPDGGVARFRVHGTALPDPRFLSGTVDLAAVEHGGQVVDCSNMFFSAPTNILLPGRSRQMDEGWEGARRRDSGNDYVSVRLGARGAVRRVEIDTSNYVGNAPGWAVLRGADVASGADLDDPSSWTELLPRTRLQPDARHFFRIGAGEPVTHVRLDVYPDGGVARLRVHGEIDPATLVADAVAWLDALPEPHALQVLATDGGLAHDDARKLLAQRPFASPDAVPSAVIDALLAR
ncbi:allantoicase [Nocardia sp. NPDC005998]|uniref:allantoicase n=1 Tax=Nocardia sp. NPDC005998 TaxID=3156894 RepID=UPI0033AE36F4